MKAADFAALVRAQPAWTEAQRLGLRFVHGEHAEKLRLVARDFSTEEGVVSSVSWCVRGIPDGKGEEAHQWAQSVDCHRLEAEDARKTAFGFALVVRDTLKAILAKAR